MEKRMYERKECSSRVNFFDPSGSYRRHVKNLSTGGMLIDASDSIDPGTELTLFYKSGGMTWITDGVVIRSGGNGLGVMFR